MASPVTFPSPSASPSHTSMPFPSPTSNHKPNPHPYAIKTTSTGVLSRSNSNSHNTHAAKNSYVPESPRNGSRSRSRHDSESDSDTGGSKSRYRGHRYSRSLTGDEMAPAPRPASANGGSMEDGKGDRPSRQRTDSMRSTSSTEECVQYLSNFILISNVSTTADLDPLNTLLSCVIPVATPAESGTSSLAGRTSHTSGSLPPLVTGAGAGQAVLAMTTAE